MESSSFGALFYNISSYLQDNSEQVIQEVIRQYSKREDFAAHSPKISYLASFELASTSRRASMNHFSCLFDAAMGEVMPQS